MNRQFIVRIAHLRQTAVKNRAALGPVLLMLLIALLPVAAKADSVTLSVSPVGGAVSGMPGSTVGWGFTFTNNTAEYAVLSDSFISGALSTGNLGVYTDFISSQFVVINPGSSVTQAFNAGALSGTGSFLISSTASLGQSASGNVNIDYSLFSQDPNSPNFDPGSFVGAGTVSAGVSASVASAVPEPSSLILFGTGAVGLLGAIRRKMLG